MSVEKYNEARNICEKLNGSLLVIPNKEFQDEIHSKLPENLFKFKFKDWLSDVEYWIGLNSFGDCTDNNTLWKWEGPNGGTNVTFLSQNYKLKNLAHISLLPKLGQRRNPSGMQRLR